MMNIMKKRISLILGIMMLAVSVIPMVNVNAVEASQECQVTMTAKMENTTLVDNGKYNVKGGEKILVTAKSSVADIEFIAYYFSTQGYDNRTKVYDDATIITVPEGKEGTSVNLYVEPVASNDNGTANTITKTGWQKYTLVYPKTATVAGKDLEVSYNGKALSVGSTTEAEAGAKLTVTTKPANTVSKIYYKWTDEEMQLINSSNGTITVPAKAEAGKTYKLLVNALHTDGLYTDNKDNKNTTSEAYYFTIPAVEIEENRELMVEPWMEENDDVEELSISLRNDSEEENKANKNVYQLDEIVTYYIDYVNGGKDINDDVTVVLELPLDFKAVKVNGGSVNKDNEIEWVLDGLEAGEAGTIEVEVQYTSLKKSRDDANTIYPTVSILKGSKVKDVSTVVNFVITEYNEELDIEHEPYMYGDANGETFRPDHIITRAEGALVLARIYGLDYKKVTTITTKYTDINTTYEEAQKAITAASEAGLINGYLEDNGTYTYRPNERMTKAEFMKILACMIQNSAADEDIDGLQIKGLDQLVKVYADAKRYYLVEGERIYSHWAIEEISLLARLNMLPLSEENSEFELDEKITRAEVAQLINFYLLRTPAQVGAKVKTGFSDVSRKHDLVGDILEATRANHVFSITEEALEVEE